MGLMWSALQGLPFGAYQQTLLIKNLIDAGYAVITPDAFAGGLTFWQTNFPPWDTVASLGLWDAPVTRSGDAGLLTHIFNKIESGAFGPLDIGNMHATGISSGGYMTSRMAF